MRFAPSVVLVDVDCKIATSDLVVVAAALQRQVLEHFSQSWSIACAVRAATSQAPARPDEIQIRLLKVPTMDGALGFHDVTPDGLPIAYVFPELLEPGEHWSVTASHELLELLADPGIHLCVEMDDGEIWDLENCFTGDTSISLLNGTEVPIRDLVGLNHFWVYSCTSDGHIVPGRAHSAKLTRENAEIVEVILDNEQTIRCTSDHKFMLRDGTYCTAADLQTGASLMPLYRRREVLHGKSEYEQVMVPALKDWRYTHRVVNTRCPPGYVRHHVDYDRFNNEPSNLRVMLKDDHLKLHGDHTTQRNNEWAAAGTHPWQRPKTEAELERVTERIREGNADPEFTAKRKAAHVKWSQQAVQDGTHPFQQPQSEAKRRQSAETLTAYNKSDAHRAVAAVVGGETFRKIWQNPEFVQKIKDLNGQRMREQNASPEYDAKRREAHAAYHAGLTDEQRAEIYKRAPETTEKIVAGVKKYWENATQQTRTKRSGDSRHAMHNRWHVKRDIVKPECEFCSPPNNHKVVSVRSVGREDVYDITVDEHHNFALTAGVFVHNCDRVESEKYLIDGVYVSNFSTRECFEPPHNRAGVRYDWLGTSTKPNEVRPGGYAQHIVNGQWKQVGEMSSYRSRLAALGFGRGTRRRARTS